MSTIAVSTALSRQFRIREGLKIRSVSWKKEILFPDVGDIPDALVIDLKQPESIDIVCALREQLSSEALPIFGFLSDDSIRLRNLFFACGGTAIVWSPDDVPELDAKKKRTDGLNFPLRITLSRGETIRRLLDNLERQTINKEIAAVSGKTDVLARTVELLMESLHRLIKIHLSVILINNNQSVESYVMASTGVFREDYKDFLNFCLNDFFTHFKGLNMENLQEVVFSGNPEEFNRIKIGTRKVSSYFYLPLTSPDGEVIGTIHLGHLSNNYFQGIYPELVSELVTRMASPLSLTLKTSQNILRQAKIFTIFSKFVPTEIIPDLIAQEIDRKKNKVQKREITVLFSDIRSFTTITEENNAQQVVDFLNRHFEMMVGIIKRYGGTIDKFIGDAIVAVFGLTGDSDDSNVNAVKAAAGMIESLDKVDCSNLVLPGGKYRIGVGLHCGEAIIGNIGSPTKKSAFTVIGDVVGIAEELEGITKHYQRPILASEAVYEDVREHVPMETVLERGSDSAWPGGLYTPGQGGLGDG